MKPTYPSNQPAMPIAILNHFKILFAFLSVTLFKQKPKFNMSGDASFGNRSFRNAFLLVLFSAAGMMANAQISSTRNGGNWNSPSTWIGGIVPGSSTIVTITGGARVTVNVNNAICNSIRIGGSSFTTGTLSFNNGSVLTVAAEVRIGSNGRRRGSIDMTSGGLLKIGGAMNVASLNRFTRGAGTIEYNGNGAQTVGVLGVYNNLVFSGTGVKSIAAGIAIAGKLSISGATASIGTGLNISVGSLALGGFNKANGTWGATISSATNKDNTYFAASNGILTVANDLRPVAVLSGITSTNVITYGSPSIRVSGTVSGSGPVYPVNGEIVRIALNGVTLNAAITGGVGGFSINFPTALLNASNNLYTIQYAYSGGFNLAPANNANASLRVNPAPLTITANNQSKSYGTVFSFTGTAFTTSGLLNGNTVATVTLSSAGAVASASIAGSPYSIVPSAATGSGLSNYAITYRNGILTVNGLSQSVADFRSRVNGNFSSPSSWQFDQGGNSWINATQAPASSNNILITHPISLNQPHTVGAGKNLRINSGGTLTIDPGISLDVAASGTLNFNAQPVIVKSTAAGTGSIGKILGTLTGASNVTVERYLGNNKRGWRFLTIPVTGITIRQAWAGVAGNAAAPAGETGGSGTLITGHNYAAGTTAAAAGFDWFTGLGNTTTSSIRFYSPANIWASAGNTPNPLALPNKQGYLLYVRGDRTIASSAGFSNTTLKPRGTLKHGLQTIPVSDPYTVVGNPYACAINLDHIYANSGNSAVIKRNFWIWDATLGTSGGYRTLSWNGVDEYDMTGGGGLASDYLAVNSGQAFMVERLAGGNISITENNKTTAIPPRMLRPAGTAGAGVSSLNIRLYQATGNTLGSQADRVVARYNDIYQESVNEIYDAAKMNNFNENLSLVRNNNYLSIESRPFPAQNDTLYLPFWGLAKRDYALTITSYKFTGINQTARLIDAFTHTESFIDLFDSSITYPFSVTADAASSDLNRFKIVMAPAIVLPVTFTKINAVRIGSKIQVSWATGSELGVKNYVVERSADGTHFTKIGQVAAINAANGASYQWPDNQPLSASNFYRIRSNDADGNYAYSGIAALQLAGKKGIEVMPTVINNQQFNLLLNDQPVGNYQLLITNAAGQQVYQKMINNPGGTTNQIVELRNTLFPTGVYNLSVNGLNGDHQNFRLLIGH